MDTIATTPENKVEGALPDGRGEAIPVTSAPAGTPGAVEFVSRSDNLRLVYRPAWEDWERGRIVKKEAEEVVEFITGHYWCEPGKKFEDGTLVLDWLRAHPNFNREFAGFVEVVPVAPAPSVAELDAITVATVNGDEAALAKLAADEQRGHAREEVLSPIRTALDALERVRAAQGSSEGQKGS